MKKIYLFAFASLMMLGFTLQTYAADDVRFSSKEDIEAYIAAAGGVRKTVRNLTIKVDLNDDYYDDKVEGLTNDVVGSIVQAIAVVEGNFTMENLMVSGLAWFNQIEFKKGFIFRNNKNLCWDQGFSGDGTEMVPGQENSGPTRKVVHGDFIVDNCPSLAFPDIDGWRPTLFFGGFERVEGSFILKDITGSLTENAAKNLTYVGGDFVITVSPKATNGFIVNKAHERFGFMGLKYVGGNIIINGNNLVGLKWTTLDLLTSLDEVRGSVAIQNVPLLKVGGQIAHWEGKDPNAYQVFEPGGNGLCYVKYLTDIGVINYACNDVIISGNADEVNFATLGGCFDGVTEGDPEPLPAKNPACYKPLGIQTPQQAVAKTSVFVGDGQLTVKSDAKIARTEIYDLTGKRVVSASNTNTINVSQLAKGIYVVKLTTGNNTTEIHKIIK
jgi:hypothetical protein